jgi:hypothetical protein
MKIKREEKMKITNYKLQITNKLQIQNYKLQTLLWRRNTDYPNGAGSQLAVGKRRNEEEKKRKREMVPMGNTDTGVVRWLTVNEKLLRGVQGGGFLEKSPPEGKRHGK